MPRPLSPRRAAVASRPGGMSASQAPVLAAGLFVAALSLMPLMYIVWSSSTVGFSQAAEFLFRPRIGELMWNTVGLVVVCVVTTTALGLGGACLVERTDLPAKGLWHGLLCAPLTVPAFVSGFAWVSFLPGAQTFGGAVLVLTLSYYPLVYLPVVAALRGGDPGVEEAAATLGHHPIAVFWRVTVPAAAPALLGGGLLVGLHVLAEYGALQLLNYPTLTTAVLQQYATVFNGPQATLLAGVLVTFCVTLLLLELLLRGRRSVATTGSGSRRPPTRLALGRARPAAVLALCALAVLALGVPLGSLARWLARGSSTGLDSQELVAAGGTTLGLAVAGGLLATLAAIPVVWLAVRSRGVAGTVIERSTYTASAVPGIVVALALVSVSIQVVPALYQTAALLLIGYAVLFLPRAVVSVRGVLELIPPRLEDVARSLGCSGPGVMARVTGPLLLPGLAASAALVSLAVATELTATLLLSPLGTETLATRFWANASSVRYGAAAPYALALVLLSLPATILLGRLSAVSRG